MVWGCIVLVTNLPKVWEKLLYQSQELTQDKSYWHSPLSQVSAAAAKSQG